MIQEPPAWDIFSITSGLHSQKYGGTHFRGALFQKRDKASWGLETNKSKYLDKIIRPLSCSHSFKMSPCRVIKYAVPDPQNRYLRPEDFVVYDHSDVHDILADFHKHAGPGSGLDAQVAFLPKVLYMPSS